MNIPKKTKIYTLIVILWILGALVWITSKIALEEITPFTLVFSRYLIATILLLPWLKVLKWKSAKNYWMLFLISLWLVGNIILFSIGVNHTNVWSAQTMYMALPLLTIIFSYFILKEPIQKHKVIWVWLWLAWVFLILILPNIYSWALQTWSFYGNFIVLMAVVSCSSYFIFSKKYSQFTPMELTIGTTVTILLVSSILAGWEYLMNWNLYQNLTTKWFLNLVLLGVGWTVGFYFLYQKLLTIASPTEASFSTYFLVIFAVLWWNIFLWEQIWGLFIVWVILAIAWVYISNKKVGK